MPRYIRTNSLKQTWLEDLRMARSWKVLFLWIPKLFRKRLDFISGIPIPVPFEDFLVAREAVLPGATAHLQPTLAAAEQLGFDPPVFQQASSLAGEMITAGATSWHQGGQIVLRALHVLVKSVHPHKSTLAVSLMSQFADGRRLVTTDQRPAMNSVPNAIVQRQVGAPLERLFAVHQARLEELSRQSAPVRVRDLNSLARFCDTAEIEALEFHLHRGVYEEIQPQEVESRLAEKVKTQERAAYNETDAAVLDEIDKLHNKKASWRNVLTVGLLSLAAFIAIGGLRWDWKFAAILTGVVAFHEMGHYVAMRLLRYRDVRMFFVPLLGAAVTGRHYNVKGWQQAIVSLAGPVPGIILGFVLIFSGLVFDAPILQRIALVSFFLNGINLLPFLPLDGGWVMHALLFSRHFVLETAFQAFAGVSLIGATMLGFGRLWMYLGIVMLVGLPASHRLTRVARRLRSSGGLVTSSEDSQTIPTDTALAILKELKEGNKGLVGAKTLAQQTLSVFQKLNATPPGVLVSLLLVIVYLGSGFGAFLGTGLVYVFRNPQLMAALEEDDPIEAPHRVEPGELLFAGSSADLKLDVARPVLVATFFDGVAARSAFDSVKPQMTDDEMMLLFGDTIFATGEGSLSNAFTPAAVMLFVEESENQMRPYVTLTCIAPDESTARQIEDDCGAVLNMPFKQWPPWSNRSHLDPEHHAAAETLLHTSSRLTALSRRVLEDPEVIKAARPSLFSLRKPSVSTMIDRAKQQMEVQQRLYRRELEQLAKSDDPRLDKDLVRIYGRYTSGDSSAGDPWKEMLACKSVQLGNMALSTNLPTHINGWSAARSGTVSHKGTVVQFNYFTFYRTDYGLPALASYLHQLGCKEFRYDLQNPSPAEQSSL